MRVLVDENIPRMTVDALRVLGYHCGILIVRLRQPNRHRIHHSVLHAIERFAETEWRGMLVVMRGTTLSTSRRQALDGPS